MERVFHREWRSYRGNTTGIVVVEFALTIPLLLLLFLGGFELGRLLLLHQKVERVAYTVNDVVTQLTAVTTVQLDQILTAAGQIMQPNDFSPNGFVILSSVYKDVGIPPAIRWQYTGGGTMTRTSQVGSTGNTATLPGNLVLNDRDNVIVAEVYFRYTPVVPTGFLDAQDIYKIVVFKPRLGVLTTPPG